MQPAVGGHGHILLLTAVRHLAHHAHVACQLHALRRVGAHDGVLLDEVAAAGAGAAGIWDEQQRAGGVQVEAAAVEGAVRLHVAEVSWSQHLLLLLLRCQRLLLLHLRLWACGHIVDRLAGCGAATMRVPVLWMLLRPLLGAAALMLVLHAGSGTREGLLVVVLWSRGRRERLCWLRACRACRCLQSC